MRARQRALSYDTALVQLQLAVCNSALMLGLLCHAVRGILDYATARRPDGQTLKMDHCVASK